MEECSKHSHSTIRDVVNDFDFLHEDEEYLQEQLKIGNHTLDKTRRILAIFNNPILLENQRDILE
jgi:hypothetical protein